MHKTNKADTPVVECRLHADPLKSDRTNDKGKQYECNEYEGRRSEKCSFRVSTQQDVLESCHRLKNTPLFVSVHGKLRMADKDKPQRPRRVTACFHGRVQGVGFRFTTVEVARNFDITGYIQNMMDGSVKMVAEGTEDDLNKLMRDIRDAHIYKYVTSEDVNWTDGKGEYKSFTIRYS